MSSNIGNGLEYPMDPYLQYRPPFLRSLPVQILLTGVVLTLVAVLFIHLAFTSQYHWPLAPVNYVLQLSGVTTLLISLIATMHVVLSASFDESKCWPYMLSYIAINIPPSNKNTNQIPWSIAERATWFLMNASTSALIQITHIQFLTLLFPSRLEARLIFTLLGPLAIVAAIMQFLPMSGNASVIDIATVVRNVCNATLSLLFTSALFIWGLLVNRRQAWRTDGGTAAFGCAALTLAMVSTALNFLYIHHQDEFIWLPSLMWAVVLWQSFLGWWWWIGSGSSHHTIFDKNDPEFEQKMHREARHDSQRRSERQAMKSKWRGLVSRDLSFHDHRQPSSKRNETQESASPSSSQEHIRPRSRRSPLTQFSPSRASITSTLSRWTVNIFPVFVQRWYSFLRREHVEAARQQAEEHAERIRAMGHTGMGRRELSCWDLGGFGWRIRREELIKLEVLAKEGRRSNGDGLLEEGAANSAPTIKSLWWWGPLQRWRLQDSTVYL